jgi:hypothetical protein
MVHEAAQLYVSVNVLCTRRLVRMGDGRFPVSAKYRISLKRFKLLGRVNLNNAVLIVCECKNIYPPLLPASLSWINLASSDWWGS